MLAARGRRTIALGLIAGLLGRILGIPELFGLAAAAVVVTLVALVGVRFGTAAVTLSARAVPPIVKAGESAHIEITIEESKANKRFVTTVVLEPDDSNLAGFAQPIEIAVPRVGDPGLAHATFSIPTLRRGFVTAGAYGAILTDPLGLARKKIGASRAVTCVVLPRVEQLVTVRPTGLGRPATKAAGSGTQMQTTGASTLRRYAQGDDLRRVHWRTTARVGALMVREGGDRDEPDRLATTVLLDAGDDTTATVDLDRAVEVAASVLTAAAESSSTPSAAYRLVTTTGLDTDALVGRSGLQTALVALAGLGPSATAGPERLGDAFGRLGPPGDDEMLVIVGAFGQSQANPLVIREASRHYAAVVVVMVGVEEPRANKPGSLSTVERRGRRGRHETAPSVFHSVPGSSFGAVLTVPLPRGSSLAGAWNLERADWKSDSAQRFTDRFEPAEDAAR